MFKTNATFQNKQYINQNKQKEEEKINKTTKTKVNKLKR